MTDTPFKPQGKKTEGTPWLSLVVGALLVVVLVVGFMVSADSGAANASRGQNADIRIDAGAAPAPGAIQIDR